jgi:hypothetical protein
MPALHCPRVEAGGRVLTRSCITWPSPARYDPAVPARAAFPSVLTLIVSGDEDTSAPAEISAVRGRAVATFLDTLHVEPNACGTFSG